MCHAFCYPIKKGREKGRHEFQKLVTTSKAKELQEIANEIGLSRLARYLQKTKDGSFYIVYQEFDVDQYDKIHDFLTNPNTQKRYQWMWDGLIEDTGWTMKQLTPHIEHLKSKAPVLSRS